MKGKQKRTAVEMRAALARHFSEPQSAIVFEVAQSTGFGANRHVDAIAMDLWPSRGLFLHGIEIKVDLYDWRRELKDPAKAEELARFCDFFWIAAPRGVVPLEEIPPAWGLFELDKDKLTATRAAAKTDAQNLDRGFVAALLRAAGRGLHPDSVEAQVEEMRQRLESEFDDKLEAALARRAERADSDAAAWNDLCSAMPALESDALRQWLGNDEVKKAVRAVYAAGIAQTWSGLADLRSGLDKAVQKIQAGLDLWAIPVPTPGETLNSRVGKRRRGGK